MEVAVPVPVPVHPVDFNFDSACSSPYMTAPSSPQRFGNFFFSSAPTSPSRAAAFYYDFNEFGSGYGGLDADGRSSSASEIPFLWEDMPGISKSGGDACSSVADEDFEFDFSGQLERTSLSAEELFDCGKIRALKPPPDHCVSDSVSSNVTSPRSSKISQGKRMVQEALSPRHQRRRDADPFEEALKAATRRTGGSAGADSERNRGRERTTSRSTTASRSSSSIRRTGSRSLSPLRVSDIMLDSDLEIPTKSAVSSSTSNDKHSISSSASFLSAFSFSRGQRRWRIRDLLLFRSASEGRATDKKAVEEMKNSSFRSMESLSSVSSSRRRGPISAHELHYKTNRAVSEELRKKTSLPYKHGLLGCLGFNSSLQRNFSRGFGSLTRA